MEKQQRTLREEALQSEAPTKSKNITELPQVSTSLVIEEETFTNNENKEVTVKIVRVGKEKYRVPQSVINSLKVMLEDNPNLKTFKVRKTGEGMDTRYTVIPLV